ncbi:MAG: hypothetical protein HC800_11760 [Phormidesmis sp. RL_2_1]|nr:hypothetical protein [Phormidesmis sp. RL_2_1]
MFNSLLKSSNNNQHSITPSHPPLSVDVDLFKSMSDKQSEMLKGGGTYDYNYWCSKTKNIKMGVGYY